MTHNVLDRMITLARAMDDSFAPVPVQDRRSLWYPPLDVYETDGAYVVELDVPGVRPEDVDISFEQATLTVRGGRAPTLKAPEKGDVRVFASERANGSFVRSVRLPEFVDAEHIEARYADGVLTVTIPKAAAARARRISIRTGGEPQRVNG